jgi:peroxiredoxin
MADLPASPPRVGEIAPDFELADSKGASRRLSGLLAERSHLLLFYRGHW